MTYKLCPVHYIDSKIVMQNSFAPIDKVEAEWQRLLKKTYWMHRLNTIYPNGMNSKVLYQISND